MFKVGDYVTQNDIFIKDWDCEIFHLRIVKIKDSIIYLNKNISIKLKSINSSYQEINKIHKEYLKLDTKYIRKLKLNKLNERR